MSDPSAGARVAVVGGGIAGLTVAHRLIRRGLDPVVFEADAVPGGKLRAIDVGGLRVEAGADAFVARKPWAVDLCRELGVPTVAPGARGSYLWTAHGLEPFVRDAPFGIPGDIVDVLRWPGLSPAGRRRAARDLLIRKRRDGAEETLGGLLRRRLGDEATDRAVAPLLAGLYAGDVDRLSARATFPELVAWEDSQGSLIRGSQAARRATDRASAGPMFRKPEGGMDRLIGALGAALRGRIRTDASVVSLDELGEVDAVVLATPTFESGRLLADRVPSVAADLAAIGYVSTGVVALSYPEGTQSSLPDGTGFVVPRGMAPMTACTWLSSKWPTEAWGSRAVLRCYVGAAGDEDVLDADDPDLIDACARHVAAVVSLPDRPEAAVVHRWPRALPQFEVGHLERVSRIRAGLPAGIFVAGNAYDGVGIPDTVRGAEEVAEQVAAYLARSRRPDEETVA
jgi:oxygen-dependent protoporphyrinogen oxidase